MLHRYTVLEMSYSGVKNIQMELKELKHFCRQERLPLFTLRVEERVQNGVSSKLHHPWCKYFTVRWDWCFWAAKKIEAENQEGV